MTVTEIGGCLPLEKGAFPFYHGQNAVLTNTGRNALRLFVRTRKIEKVFVPAFTCPVVPQALRAENADVVLYDLNEDLTPAVVFPKNAYILYNNWFGVCGKKVRALSFEKLIVDAAQAFYAGPRGEATVYSPRKFFGVPDGGALVCSPLPDAPLSRDFSYDRAQHLLTAADLGSDKAYDSFAEDEDALNGLPVLKMSRLTETALSAVDYVAVRRRRLENFAFLHGALGRENGLVLDLADDDVPMVYPFLTSDPLKLRTKLLKAGIDTAVYWEGTEEQTENAPVSRHLCRDVVPLPLDQRYGATEMERIARAVLS